MAHVAMCVVVDGRQRKGKEWAQALARWNEDPHVNAMHVLDYRGTQGETKEARERKDTDVMEAKDLCRAVRRAVQRLKRMPGDTKCLLLTCTGPIDKRVLEQPNVLQTHGKLVEGIQADVRILVVGNHVSEEEQRQWCDVADRLAGKKRGPKHPARVHLVSWEELNDWKLEHVEATSHGKDSEGQETKRGELKPTRGASSVGIMPTCANEKRLTETCAKVKKTTAVGVEVPEEKRVEVVPIAKLHHLAKTFTTPLVEIHVGRLETTHRYHGNQKRTMLVPHPARGKLALCYAPNGGIQLLCTLKNPKGYTIEEVVYVPEGRWMEEEDVEAEFLQGDDTGRSFCLKFRIGGRVVGPNTMGKGTCRYFFWLVEKDALRGREAVRKMVQTLQCPPSLSMESKFSPSVLRAIKRGLQEAETQEMKRLMSQRAHQARVRPSSIEGAGRERETAIAHGRASDAAPLRKGFLCVRRTRRPSVHPRQSPAPASPDVGARLEVPVRAGVDRSRLGEGNSSSGPRGGWQQMHQEASDPAKAEVLRALTQLQDAGLASSSAGTRAAGTSRTDGCGPESSASSHPVPSLAGGPSCTYMSTSPPDTPACPPSSMSQEGNWKADKDGTHCDGGGGRGGSQRGGIPITTHTLSDYLDAYDRPR